MEKINRLGWAAGLSFISHGARVGIRVNDPQALEQIQPYLPPHWKPSPSPLVRDLCSLVVAPNCPASNLRRYNLLYWGAARIARTLETEEALRTLEALLHLVVSTRAARRVFVHAAVAGWGKQALVICGPPGSGKTTLLEALLRAGATCYSDRYAVLDARGRVHPYVTPLLVREEGQAHPRRCSAESLGGSPATEPLPIGLVLFTAYRPGARWRPCALSSGQGLLALLGASVQARLRPQRVLSTLRRVADRALVLRGRRGEAAEMIEPLFERLQSKNGKGRLRPVRIP